MEKGKTILNFCGALSGSDLFWQTIRTMGFFYLFIVCLLSVVLIIRALVKIPRDIFRKVLHSIAFCMIIPLVYLSENYVATLICLAVTVLLIFVILSLVENCSWYEGFFVQKKPGEVKTSMLLLFGMEALTIFVSQGLCRNSLIAVAAVLMWGVGDSFAAIIGRRHGKRKITWKIADHNKTWEGMTANAVSSFVIGFVLFLGLSGHVWYFCLAEAVAGAVVSAFVEAVCRNGTDTFFVPVAIMGVLIVCNGLLF